MDHYDEIVFVVADYLQIYNKIMQSPDPSTLPSVLKGFRERQQHIRQRRRWLERLRQRLNPMAHENCPRWTVLSVEDVTDCRCFRIFRNVMLAYYAIDDFREDVAADAHRHASSRRGDFPLHIGERLSTGYLLEELALSVRIRVVGKIWDEYYDGPQAAFIIKTYAGAYPVSVFDLAEEEPNSSNIFRFFGPVGPTSNLVWDECRLPCSKGTNAQI